MVAQATSRTRLSPYNAAQTLRIFYAALQRQRKGDTDFEETREFSGYSRRQGPGTRSRYHAQGFSEFRAGGLGWGAAAFDFPGAFARPASAGHSQCLSHRRLDGLWGSG